MSTPRNLATRFVHLDMGQVRDRAQNRHTLVAGTDPHLERAALPFEQLFVTHYRRVRELARVPKAGAALLAVHAPTGELAGRVWVSRHRDRPNAAIVGRHSECDLVLDHGGLSLRHLALVVPREDDGAARFWLRELRTKGGLDSAEGKTIGGAFVEGAGLFRVGGYALIALATGAPELWPEDPREGWRLLQGQREGLRLVGVDPAPPRPRPSRERTPSVSVIRGPLQTSEQLIAPGQTRVCTLQLVCGARRQRLALDEAALGRGVLLGRYTRCDSSDVLRSSDISRVHALVCRVEHDLVAIDTASTHGLFASDESKRARVVTLSKQQPAILGDGEAFVQLV